MSMQVSGQRSYPNSVRRAIQQRYADDQRVLPSDINDYDEVDYYMPPVKIEFNRSMRDPLND